MQNGSRESWKLGLNLCSRKWLIPARNLLSSLIPWELCTLNLLLGFGLINLRISFLKALTDSEFRILLSCLFQAITVDGKKECRKYSYLTLNKGLLLWFLVSKSLWESYQRGKRDVFSFFKSEKQAQFSVPSP